MPLSHSEEGVLRTQYDTLAGYYFESAYDQNKWLSGKERIISFCVTHEIHLYNIVQLGRPLAQKLLNHLLTLFGRLSPFQKEYPLKWTEEAISWKKTFEDHVKKIDLETLHMHDEAYLSVGDQYNKTNKVEPNTLLTFRDMVTLFTAHDFITERVLLSKPFSLDPRIEQQEELLHNLIQENIDDKMVFIPITHEGHWVYLLKQKNNWIIKDSQPFLEGNRFTPKQESIHAQSIEFIKRLTKSANPHVIYETTGEQDNNYDCGTQVINAYRSLANEHYQKKTHKDILIELALTQVASKEKLPLELEQIFGPKSRAVAKEPEAPPLSASSKPTGALNESGVPPAISASAIAQKDTPAPSNTQFKKIPSQFTKENFLKLLDPIKKKQALRLIQYPQANRAVTLLNKKITNATNDFFEADFNQKSLEIFERNCIQAITAAEKKLGTHRYILGSLLAGIANFFVVLWKTITGSSENRHRLKFFDGRSDSAKILQDLKENIQTKNEEYRQAFNC